MRREFTLTVHDMERLQEDKRRTHALWTDLAEQHGFVPGTQEFDPGRPRNVFTGIPQ